MECYPEKHCRLNLGSGQRPFKAPFLNYDIQIGKWRDYTLEQGCKWVDMPWARTYEMIVLHHVLEHFGCGEADDLVGICYEALEKKGSLIVCVPDVYKLARGWMTNRIDIQVYLTNVYGAYMGADADRHKWGYTTKSLIDYLSKWEWRKLEPFDFRDIVGADIAKDWYITGVEGIK